MAANSGSRFMSLAMKTSSMMSFISQSSETATAGPDSTSPAASATRGQIGSANGKKRVIKCHTRAFDRGEEWFGIAARQRGRARPDRAARSLLRHRRRRLYRVATTPSPAPLGFFRIFLLCFVSGVQGGESSNLHHDLLFGFLHRAFVSALRRR